MSFANEILKWLNVPMVFCFYFFDNLQPSQTFTFMESNETAYPCRVHYLITIQLVIFIILMLLLNLKSLFSWSAYYVYSSLTLCTMVNLTPMAVFSDSHEKEKHYIKKKIQQYSEKLTIYIYFKSQYLTQNSILHLYYHPI